MQALVEKKQRDLAAFAAQPRAIPTVEAEKTTTEIWQQYLYSIGSFTARDDVDVTNEVEGKVTAIHFSSGQKVAKGDILITLDTSVDSAELRALRAEQELQELQFKRSERLLREKTVSKSEFDIAAARRDESIAMTQAKLASVEKKTIRAPFDGVLGIRKVDLGEYLDAGAVIVNLQNIAPIYLDFGTPERNVGDARVGLEIEAEVQSYPDAVFRGRLSAIEPGIDRATRNLFMRAEFSNSDLRLRPGMFADVRGLLAERKTVLTIPETAVSFTPYGNSVFVLEDGDGAMQVARRMIETGSVRNGRIEVTSGLNDSELIVSTGHNKLRNGMQVQTGDTKRLSSANAK